MALYTLISATPLSVSVPNHHVLPTRRRFLLPLATLGSESSASTPTNSSPVVNGNTLTNSYGTRKKDPDDNSLTARFFRSTESNVERIIFDFRFLALLAVGGSLAGSLLCFLNGCVYIMEAYKVYWTNCVKGIHTGQMVLRLVEAIDVYLAGTVMLIFSMGLYGLFISNSSPDVPAETDRALKASSLFGMFAMKERPKWMKISSLDELKTKVGHVIVMILLVKMFERSKMVTIATGLDLLSYSVCIFLSSASLYILHNLHKGEH
uniref:Structural constituent of ribosome n=1 Tax=Noccaea caerulescens TaxID=107243 RepID=A0A1J3GU89_NOCCA